MENNSFQDMKQNPILCQDNAESYNTEVSWKCLALEGQNEM